MSLWDAMLSGWITGRSFQRAECSLAGDASLKLPLDFLGGALFERIGATTYNEACDHEQDRHAFHLYILWSEYFIARSLEGKA
jgi:hypothetical protein